MFFVHNNFDAIKSMKLICQSITERKTGLLFNLLSDLRSKTPFAIFLSTIIYILPFFPHLIFGYLQFYSKHENFVELQTISPNWRLI